MGKASDKKGAQGVESGWLRGARPYVLICLAGALAHVWCLGSQFFLDDVLQIRDADDIHEGTWWESSYRKWTYLFYWLQYKVWGSSPVGYHAVNWLLHVGVAVMLYLFGRDALPGKETKGMALCGALLFVVHPLGSEIPNYARTQDLAWVTLFSIGAAWLAVRCVREFRWSFLAGMVGCVIGATYSKDPGMLHVAMMVGFAVLGCCPGEVWCLVKRYWKLVVALLILGGVVAFWNGEVQSMYHRVSWGWSRDEFGWHAVTLCRVFWKFVGLFLFPRGLSSDHFIAGTYSWEDPEAVPAVVGLVIWCLVASGLMIKKQTRFVGMCLWLFAGAIVFRMVYNINEFMPEYRIYPGLPWLCLGVIVVAWAGWRRVLAVSPSGVMSLLVLILCAVSATRSFRWHDLDRLSEDTLELYPGHLRSLWILQRRDVEEERWEEVIARHPRVAEVTEAFVGVNKRLKGKRLSAGHHTLAEVACLGYYAAALAGTGREKEALELMERVEAYLRRINRFDEANKVFVHVYYHRLGRVYEVMGDYEAALEALDLTDRRNHRRVDIDRVNRKLEEARGGV